MEEQERWRCDELPEVAAVPVMKRKSFKELGTPTVQAAALANTVQEFSADELLALAERKREQLEADGEIDRVGDEQPEDPPPFNDTLVGTKLERHHLVTMPLTASSHPANHCPSTE